MKIRDFECDAKIELKKEQMEFAKVFLKERMKELAQARRVIEKLERQYEKWLDMDVDELRDQIDG